MKYAEIESKREYIGVPDYPFFLSTFEGGVCNIPSKRDIPWQVFPFKKKCKLTFLTISGFDR